MSSPILPGNKSGAVPWQDKESWAQVETFFHVSLPEKSSLAEICALAGSINKKLLAVDHGLQLICEQTCPACEDTCCSRATVWYDFRDLVFQFFGQKRLPDEQIYRYDDLSCCNLTGTGCKISRNARPFICTWYICSHQRQISAANHAFGSYADLVQLLEVIQRKRKELEMLFIHSLTAK